MGCRRLRVFPSAFTAVKLFVIAIAAVSLPAGASAQTSSSSGISKSHAPKTRPAESSLDAGSVGVGAYRNPSIGFTCKIPAGWVLRTEEMNTRDSQSDEVEVNKTRTSAAKSGRVLLAAFSRPPEARAEDVNSSILIAAESAAAYPGLKDAAQYFGPVTEVAKSQGLETDGEPYEFVIGTKTVARGDFHKDVGTRVMRQSTLVVLARGYAVSFTFIGGTEDEVEELVQGLSLGAAKTAH
jgi:hypothetical protein